MKKYQIKEVKEIYYHAGSKAVEDAAKFAAESGYEYLYIRQRVKDTGFLQLLYNQFGFLCDWLHAFLKIEKGSVVFLQNPFKRKHLGMFFALTLIRKVKKAHIISLVHDVNLIRRTYYRDYSKTEFEFMAKNSEYFIVHNDKMAQYLIENGFSADKLIPLQIFDYDIGNTAITEKKQTADLAVAGNLHVEKAPYVYSLGKLKNPVSVNLYGLDYSGNTSENIRYFGAFPSDEIPAVIEGKFGLVWDGKSVDTCLGETGNYLRYNDPHKTSLYLVSGLPIMIWSEAAMADFVISEGIGITVSSLEDVRKTIDSVSDSEYENMKIRVRSIGEKLKRGDYIKQALNECERRISASR